MIDNLLEIPKTPEKEIFTVKHNGRLLRCNCRRAEPLRVARGIRFAFKSK
jgi:hypothetical protein